MPVILPPGLLRAATRPALTGSSPTLTTIGVVAAASFAASTVPKLPVAAITAAWRRTRSAARQGSRSIWKFAQRYSIAFPAIGEPGFVEPLTEGLRVVAVRLGR